jgi:D-sedoheptulose 7-phosphate isomerase
MQSIIQSEFLEHIKISNLSIDSIISSIETAAKICINTLQNNGKILIFGNGGSAADAQHIAAELVGRYKTERKGVPAIALTTDTSILTSISNDFGYDFIFERQVQSLANRGDTIIGISTSGASPNVINALKIASILGCNSIGFSGEYRKEMDHTCDINISIPSSDTPRIQEMHILVGHIICHLIDQELKP